MTQTIDRMSVQESGAARGSSGIEVHRLTSFIGAELRNVSLADAANDPAVFEQIKDLLLQHKVLFFRDQPISRADHVKLAERFGPLEGHPVAGSDPEHPGLVRIYKDLDSKPEQYENAFHCDATWREAPPMGSVLRCVQGPAVGGDTIWVDMVAGVQASARAHQDPDRRPARPAQHRVHLRCRDARPRSASRCRRCSPTRSTRSCGPTPRPARRCCSSTPSPPTSPTSTPPPTCATGTTTAPAAASCSTT